VHISSAGTWRGGEAQIFNLMSEQRKDGLDPTLIAQEGGELFRRATGAGFKVSAVRMRGEWDLLASSRIRRAVRELRPEVVHMHDAHALALGRFALKGVDFCGKVFSRRVDYPIRWLSKYVWVDKIIAVAELVKRVLVECGVPENKIEVVHSGVDISRLGNITPLREEILAEYKWGRDSFIIGFVGALVEQKAPQDFVEVAKYVSRRLPQARFIMVGEGELRGAVERRIKAGGLEEQVKLTGFREDVYSLMKSLDVIVFTSVKEGLCSTILEAQALRVPVVATAAGGVPEILEDGKTGLLAQVGDIEALGEKVLKLLEDKELRKKLVENAFEQVRGRFTSYHTHVGTLRVYEEVLKARAAA